jgi:hypothetical protein
MIIFSFNFVFIFQCSENEFGCEDGSCVLLEKRCDEIRDCDDQSDEKDCDLIGETEGLYQKWKPPIVSLDNKTNIDVNISLFSIGDINEMAMTFKAKFEFEV